MLRTYTLTAVFLVSSPCFAQQIAFEYTGDTGFFPGSFFGTPIPSGTPVSGAFRFDPASPATHVFSENRIGYRQQIPDGLTLTVGLAAGAIDIVAEEFLVIVSDDVAFPLGGGFFDAVEFAFQTDFVPPLTTPLEVNGKPVTTADVNRDALVDIADHDALASAFGSSSEEADLNLDQAVDAADFVVLRDGGGGPLGLLSIGFQSFADPFDTTDLAQLDLANTLMLDPSGTFLSSFNPVSNNLGFTPVDFTFDLTTLALASSTPSLESAAIPEPVSIVYAAAIVAIAGLRCRTL